MKKIVNERDLREHLDKLTHEVVQLKSILINKEQPRKPKANGAWRDLMKASKEVATLWTGGSAIEEIQSQREL